MVVFAAIWLFIVAIGFFVFAGGALNEGIPIGDGAVTVLGFILMALGITSFIPGLFLLLYV